MEEASPFSLRRSQYTKPLNQLGPRLSRTFEVKRSGNTDVTPEPANSTLLAGSTCLLACGKVDAVGFKCGATE